MKTIAFFIVKVLLFGLVSAENDNLNKIGKSGFVEIGNDTYYIDTTEDSTWINANTYCNGIGMRLVSLQTEEKYQLILDFLNANGYNAASYWTSGHMLSHGQWLWTGTGQLFTYTDWSIFGGDPNEDFSTEPCMSFALSNGWYDNPSWQYRPYNFICEY